MEGEKHYEWMTAGAQGCAAKRSPAIRLTCETGVYVCLGKLANFNASVEMCVCRLCWLLFRVENRIEKGWSGQVFYTTLGWEEWLKALYCLNRVWSGFGSRLEWVSATWIYYDEINLLHYSRIIKCCTHSLKLKWSKPFDLKKFLLPLCFASFY